MHPTVSFELAKSRIAHLRRQPRRPATEALPTGPPQALRDSPAGIGLAVTTSSGPAAVDQVQMRLMEKTGGWTHRERLRVVWYRLRLTVQEMNYATRRMAELQARLPGQPPLAPKAITQPGRTPKHG